jgi:hypothetical protein
MDLHGTTENEEVRWIRGANGEVHIHRKKQLHVDGGGAASRVTARSPDTKTTTTRSRSSSI